MTDWTRLCSDAACIETEVQENSVWIRDSGEPDFVLAVPRASWEAFLAKVRAPLEARIRGLEEELDNVCSNEVVAAYLESKESYE